MKIKSSTLSFYDKKNVMTVSVIKNLMIAFMLLFVGSPFARGASGNSPLNSDDVVSPANTIPLDLIYFNAENNNGNIELTWATSSESGNGLCTLEHAVDGSNFEELAIGNSYANNTTAPTSCTIDANPFLGVNYYRLKKSNSNGIFSYSKIISLRVSQIQEKKSIYFEHIEAKLFTDRVELSYHAAMEGIAEIEILNLVEQKVFSKKINVLEGSNEYQFLGAVQLIPGAYFINFKFNGQRIIQKMIIN